MITYPDGSIFDSGAEALVNPVNCRGVMGAGLARAFAERWPEIVPPYRRACEDKTLALGTVLVHPLGHGFVIYFPTKGHWTEKSKVSSIAMGLKSLASTVRQLELASVAVPALGCGLGGLHWVTVRPLIVAALGWLKADVMVYGPRGRRG